MRTPHPFIVFVRSFIREGDKPITAVTFSDGKVMELEPGDTVGGSLAGPDLIKAGKAARDFICTDGFCDSCGGSLKDGELPPHTGCVCGPILGALKKAGVSDK